MIKFLTRENFIIMLCFFVALVCLCHIGELVINIFIECFDVVKYTDMQINMMVGEDVGENKGSGEGLGENKGGGEGEDKMSEKEKNRKKREQEDKEMIEEGAEIKSLFLKSAAFVWLAIFLGIPHRFLHDLVQLIQWISKGGFG
jgi:hypothetical protein